MGTDSQCDGTVCTHRHNYLLLFMKFPMVIRVFVRDQEKKALRHVLEVQEVKQNVVHQFEIIAIHY